MSHDSDTGAAPKSPGLADHGPGFLVSGLTAFAVDTGLTSLLTRGFGVSPLAARTVAIAVAIVVAWACHRRFTFKMRTAATLAEFGRYLAVAWVSSAINYGVYAATLAVLPWAAPEAALVAATAVSMVVTYVGLRFGVFKPQPMPPSAGQ
jgi:putative flippase GtrA